MYYTINLCTVSFSPLDLTFIIGSLCYNGLLGQMLWWLDFNVFVFLFILEENKWNCVMIYLIYPRPILYFAIHAGVHLVTLAPLVVRFRSSSGVVVRHDRCILCYLVLIWFHCIDYLIYIWCCMYLELILNILNFQHLYYSIDHWYKCMLLSSTLVSSNECIAIFLIFTWIRTWYFVQNLLGSHH